MGSNDFRRASESFEKAIEIDPHVAQSHYLHAQALDGLGNRRDAVEAATRAVERAAKSKHSDQYTGYLKTLKEKEQSLAIA